MTTKITTDNIASETLTTILGPKVSSIVYPGDDTAANTAGGDSITLLGSGFNNGASVIVNGTSAGVVTVVSSTQITFTAPAQTAGTYVIYVINSDGGTAISIPGISYSGTPTWSTTAGNIGVGYETGSISTTVTASGDAPITYSVVSGTLPTGSSLNTSSGLISGTASATASSTTYSFTIKATDAQNQDTNRAFSITVNPDVVTWSSPANSTTYEVFKDIAIANVAMSATSASGGSITYTADTLPTGVSITGANIAGTPTVAASTTTTLTATSTSTRSATRTINWVVSIANDTYFKNTTLLLNGETTVTPFISDASANSFGLTIVGDTKPVLFNPYQEGYYSNYFDGTGDYLTFPNNSAFAFGTGSFTIEFWINAPLNNNKFILSGRAAITSLHITTGGYNGITTAGALRYGSTGVGTSVVVCDNTWHHCAIVRNGSSAVTMYVDGVSRATTTDSTNYSTTSGTWIIASNDSGPPSEVLTGYLSNLRIVKGTAVYTSNFTPSTTPLTAVANTSLLTCQSNRLIDNSTNAFSITKNGDVTVSSAIPFTQNSSYSTYGSTYFDGTGDTLSIPSPTTGFSLGTGEFTIECWVYKPSALNTVLLDARSSAAGLPWAFVIDGSNFPYWYDNIVYTSTVAVTLNSWNHVAVVRTSGVLKIFVNGVQGYSASYGTNLDRTSGLIIGDTVHAAAPLLGYISDLRIVKGTAVYTTAFTPPTTPLTAIANTQLLTCQYNGGATNQAIIDNSNFNNIITRVGNTSQGSFSPYSVTGWSNYFDGTDYLTISPNASVAFNTGDFTVEMWVYMSTDNTNRALIETRAVDLSVNGFVFAIEATGGRFLMVFSNSKLFTTTNSISLNVWTHVALTRTGTTMRCFINGVQGASVTNSQNYTNTAFTIGSGIYASSGFDGYISNLRIIKGTALYTTTFTPSTTPLTAIANTSLLTCQSNRFIDNSPNSFTLTRNGDTSVQAFGPFGSVTEAIPITYSNFFDGTGDYLTIPTNAAFTFGTGDFTIEGWLYMTTVTSATLFDNRTGTTSLHPVLYYTGSTFSLYVAGAGAITGPSAVANQWYHVAISRASANTKMFINGTQVGSTYADTNNYATSGTVGIGAGLSAGNIVTGYISNLRVIKGTGLYSANFTPSTTPLTAIANTSLLTCQSTRMIDNSTNAFTITAAGNTVPRIFNPFGYTAQSSTSYTPTTHGGSIYLDGTGDYISTPAINWSTYGSYTFEFWIYHSSFTQGSQAYASTGGTGYTNFYCYGSTGTYPGAVCVGIQGTNEIRTPNNTITGFGWYYITYTYDGTTTNIFVNGIKQTTSVASSTAVYSNNSASFIIGSGLQGAATFGYMSDVRLTKGTPLYTSNFVPPTQTLTNYSTTIPASLLLNFNNGGIIDQHGSNVLETLGNAQLSTAVKKYNVASMYFDGTGDYLTFAPTQATAFGTGDFTLEFWVYPITKVGTYPGLFGNQSFTTNSFVGYERHGSYPNNFSVFCYNYTSGGAMLVSTTTVSINTWYHIAITRSGSTFRLFVNGTIEATVTFAGSVDGGVPLRYIGSDYVTNPFAGYLDEFRITKGYARYTSNFTAPTSAFITK